MLTVEVSFQKKELANTKIENIQYWTSWKDAFTAETLILGL